MYSVFITLCCVYIYIYIKRKCLNACLTLYMANERIFKIEDEDYKAEVANTVNNFSTPTKTGKRRVDETGISHMSDQLRCHLLVTKRVHVEKNDVENQDTKTFAERVNRICLRAELKEVD